MSYRSLRALWLLLCCAGFTAVASEANPFLLEAKQLYEQFEYDKCVRRLDQAAQWKSTPAELVDIELYAGLCESSRGRVDEAREHFALAHKLDANVQLPPYTSPKIVDLFDSTRAPKPPAADAPVRTPTPPVENPAPPVTTQRVHPRQVGGLELSLGALSVVAVGVGVGFGVSAEHLATQANNAGYTYDATRLGHAARGHQLTANVLFTVGVAAATSALLTWWLRPRGD